MLYRDVCFSVSRVAYTQHSVHYTVKSGLGIRLRITAISLYDGSIHATVPARAVGVGADAQSSLRTHMSAQKKKTERLRPRPRRSSALPTTQVRTV